MMLIDLNCEPQHPLEEKIVPFRPGRPLTIPERRSHSHPGPTIVLAFAAPH